MKNHSSLIPILLILAATGASSAKADTLWGFTGTGACGETFNGGFTTDDNGILIASSIVGKGGCLSHDGNFDNLGGAATPTDFSVADNPFTDGDDNLNLNFVNPLTPAPLGTVDNLVLELSGNLNFPNGSYYLDCCSDIVAVQGSATVTPEPASVLLIAGGLIPLWAVRRYRRKA